MTAKITAMKLTDNELAAVAKRSTGADLTPQEKGACARADKKLAAASQAPALVDVSTEETPTEEATTDDGPAQTAVKEISKRIDAAYASAKTKAPKKTAAKVAQTPAEKDETPTTEEIEKIAKELAQEESAPKVPAKKAAAPRARKAATPKTAAKGAAKKTAATRKAAPKTAARKPQAAAPTGHDVVAFFEGLRASGDLPPATARNYSKVFSNVVDYHDEGLDAKIADLDMDALIIEHLDAHESWKDSTRTAQKGYALRALALFRAHLADPEGWKVEQNLTRRVSLTLEGGSMVRLVVSPKSTVEDAVLQAMEALKGAETAR